MEPHKLIKELEGIVGRSSVIHHPDDLLVFAYDGLVDTGTPQAVVFPTATEQVSQVLALANSRNIPVIPRGAGTGLSGGAIAHTGGIELSLTRMSSILEIDPANRTALVEPGVVNLDLSTAASAHGLYFAPDPSSQRACTIGGNVAENSGGPHCLKYGVTTNHVLALEVVLEDGSVLWVGDAYRGRPGYDLVGALVGSEGMLGVFTKAIVALLPLPESVRTLLAVFSDIDLASNAVSKVIASGLIPTAMEMMDSLTIRAVEKAMNFGYPKDAGAILLIEIDGLEPNDDDILLAYHNEVLIGSALWDGKYTALPVMGRDISEQTIGFIEPGQTPTIKIYQSETGNLVDLNGTIEPFESLGVYTLELTGNTTIIPEDYVLHPAYPNPFNPITNISYGLPEDTHIELEVYNIKGMLIETLSNGLKSAGTHTIKWDAKGVSSGVYFVKLTTDRFSQSQKLMVIK